MLIVLVVSVACTTPAEHIDNATAAFQSLDYDIAADEAMAAMADPHATKAELVRAGLLAGIANRVVGKDNDARMSFRVALLADPEVTLPSDTPPKVHAFFEIVRKEFIAERESHAAAQPVAPPPPPAPDPAPPPDPPPWPWAVAGVGGGVLVIGALVALMSEAALGDAGRAGGEKQLWQRVGWGAVGAAAIGAAVGVAGAVVGIVE